MVPVSEASSILSVLKLFSFRDMLFSSFNIVFFGSVFWELRYVTYYHLHETLCVLHLCFFLFFFLNKCHLGLNNTLPTFEWSPIGERMAE